MVSYTTVSPLPVPVWAIGGLFSAALSVGLPRLDVIQHLALWSPDFPQHLLVPRPSGGLATSRIRASPAALNPQSWERFLPASQPARPDTVTAITASQITCGVGAGLPPNRAMTRIMKAKPRPVTMP